MTDILIISGTTWTVPFDWNDADNRIELISGGGGGGGGGVGTAGVNNGAGAGGGKGGGYSLRTNVNLTPLAVMTIQIGAAGLGDTGSAAGGNGTPTFFDAAGTQQAAAGNGGGGGGTGTTAGTAGTATNGTPAGDTTTNGGDGGAGGPGNTTGGGGGASGGGGGGAAGEAGTGGTGGTPASTSDNGGTGGQGDNSTGGTGGAGGLRQADPTAGGAGNPGTEMGDGSAGAGGGGGGGGGGASGGGTGGANGGNGGNYGAGGGGGGGIDVNEGGASGDGGNGIQGAIWIFYTPATVDYDQTDYRFRNDDGSETTATWIAATNNNPASGLLVNQNYRIRIAAANDGADTASGPGIQWQFSRNGGAWTSITASTREIAAAASANFANGDDTTQQISVGTFESDNNAMLDTAGSFTITGVWQTGNVVETELCYQAAYADVRDGDTVQFRLVDSTGLLFSTYTQTPQFTISIPVNLAWIRA